MMQTSVQQYRYSYNIKSSRLRARMFVVRQPPDQRSEKFDCVKHGDLVVLAWGVNNYKSLIVDEKDQFNCQAGFYFQQDFVGAEYGSRILPHCETEKRKDKPKDKRGIKILRPTPELWTKSLPHRTQILYVSDISMIVTNLELVPGSIVLEAGTGSGSLTHSLARAIAPTGQVHTFEFHEQRAQEAQQEFKAHGIEHLVTGQHRDVCVEGVPEELVGKLNAIFFDIPNPWDAVAKCSNALVAGGRICTFSPCIEQVQKACGAMVEHGFHDLQTLECQSRQYVVRREIYVPDLTTDNYMSSKRQAEDARRQNMQYQDQTQPQQGDQPPSRLSAFASPEARLHTGFLTFATKSAPPPS